MKRFLSFASGIGLATLGTLVVATTPLRFGPDFFLVPVAAAARPGTPVAAMLTGLLAGFIQDALGVPGGLFGLNAFSKVLVGYVLATLGARTLVVKPVSVGLLLALASVADAMTVGGVLWVLRGEFLVASPGPLALRALLTGAVAAVVHAILRFPWKEWWRLRRRRRR